MVLFSLMCQILCSFIMVYLGKSLIVDLNVVFYDTCRLKQESGLFFDMKYFKDQVEAGEWEEVERYLSGFLKVNDESRTIFFEISKQKYLEALDRYALFPMLVSVHVMYNVLLQLCLVIFQLRLIKSH